MFGVFPFRAIKETLHFGNKRRVQIIDVLLSDGVLGHRLDRDRLANLYVRTLAGVKSDEWLLVER